MLLATSFVSHLERVSFVTSALVAVLGLVALVFVCWFWERVTPYYREFWAKFAVAFFRFVAAA